MMFRIPQAASGIKIKEENKGKFTEYCGGNVTEACIQRGKNSDDPAIRKRATFAQNARGWANKSQEGDDTGHWYDYFMGKGREDETGYTDFFNQDARIITSKKGRQIALQGTSSPERIKRTVRAGLKVLAGLLSAATLPYTAVGFAAAPASSAFTTAVGLIGSNGVNRGVDLATSGKVLSIGQGVEKASSGWIHPELGEMLNPASLAGDRLARF